MSRFRLSKEALADIGEIAEFIAQDSPEAAGRVLDQLYGACALLAKSPSIGHSRADLTDKPVLF